jgi:hypothetical protein
VGERNAYTVLMGKFEGKTPLGRYRRGWEDNIRIGVHEWDRGVNWINLAQERDKWRVP